MLNTERPCRRSPHGGRVRRGLRVVLAVLVVLSHGCGDGNVAARAGDYELTVDRFAAVLGRTTIPLRPDVAERFAWMWIEYSLLGQRLSAGDTLLDSATVLQAMWPDERDILVGKLQQHVIDERFHLDSATVDSAYLAGDHRLLYHVLIQPARGVSSEQLVELRDSAETIRTRLASGGSWDEANRVSDDAVARSSGGRIGVLTRGETVPEFEQAAFSLAPGEFSQVTRTDRGFHIIWRPPLDQVRDDYTAFLEDFLLERVTNVYTGELAERWNVRLTDEASTIAKHAAEQPYRALGARSPVVLATYEGARITNVDFARWLQALPVEYHIQLEQDENDERVRERVRWAVNYQVQYLEAKQLGLALEPEDYARLKEQYVRRLTDVRTALRIDSTLARHADPAERSRAVQEQIERYIEQRAGRRGRPTIVPPFLAHKLRNEANWQISFQAIERALERAQLIRDGRENAADEQSTEMGVS